MLLLLKDQRPEGILDLKEEQIGDNNYSLEKLVPEIVNELKTFEEKYNQVNTPYCSRWNLYRR